MNHKILIAVDNSEIARRVIGYVADMIRYHPDVLITLHHVILHQAGKAPGDAPGEEVDVEELKRAALEDSKNLSALLVEAGLPPDRIRIQIQACDLKTSIAPLILDELRKNQYGTIVVGRRDKTKREEFIFGSVSSKIVREAKGCAVWVVE